MNNHMQTTNLATRASLVERCLDCALAVAIGAGLAVLLVLELSK